ncbi:Glycogen synthase [termite gut metagenome]|uniref:Glycogen synthase n=1 Tax=termite gut metagenome TaxID=433724 RepID=A0A5J4S537_9ZZZZ
MSIFARLKIRVSMTKKLLSPDYLFEVSWEVCNKVGGIYTVLSTRANTLQAKFPDKLFFIGPDIWQYKTNPLFIESENLFTEWKKHACEKDNLSIRIGRWNIPGNPIVILIDFQPFFVQKNRIYAQLWEDFQVDSLHAYGDYDEASMFSYAAAKVAESFCRYHTLETDKVIYQAHEWMTGLGALYLQKAVPHIATIFTTHATSIGRSIAGNDIPLYDYLFTYDGDQMAQALNMESKHSIEKQTAWYADCFTTVSEITGNECKELLNKIPDVILPNGFENDFVPKGVLYTKKRKNARKLMLNVANKLFGTDWSDDTLIIGTSGRYEFKNKGIDVYLQSLSRLQDDKNLKKNVLALITVPAWVKEARKDLQMRLHSKESFTKSLEFPFITHWLHNETEDRTLGMLRHLGMNNRTEDRVKVIFVPCYLNGEDGIFNMKYYELLPGLDLSIYPSYYEPWGYTPLESIAFRVPTITTDMAGFGRWVQSLESKCEMDTGVTVLHRSDNNYFEVADAVKNTVSAFSAKTEEETENIRRSASHIAKQALWKHFITYYYEAYDIALRNVHKRITNK